MIFESILSDVQLKVLSKLDILPKNSYMAGGTALALQLGHRTSLDFDFYTDEHFDPEILLAEFQKTFTTVLAERLAKDTLTLEANGVSISIFYYPYKMVRPTINFKNIRLASVEDILAMKMIAISMRGKRRDFVDAYHLLKKFGLKQIIKLTLEKYPTYQPMMILKGLIYFEAAERDDILRKIKIFDKNFFWDDAKKEIFTQVEKYQWKEVTP